MSYTALKSLNVNSFGWQARVRLTKKTGLIDYINSRTHQPGVRCSFQFMDNEGTSIRAAAFDKFAKLWHGKLDVGDIYVLSGTAIREVTTNCETFESSLELTFTKFTALTKIDEDDGFPTFRPSFTPLAQVVKLREVKTINVIGWIEEVGEVEDVVSSKTGQELKKREVGIVDKSLKETTVPLVLWGTFAENLGSQGTIRVIDGISSLYGGGISINSTPNTQIIVDGDDSESTALRQWHEQRRTNNRND